MVSQDLDLAVSVVDEVPAGIRREPLVWDHFVCLYDPRHAAVTDPFTEAAYFEHDHVIVSYNGDLRGLVEDLTGKQRRIRCSVSGFTSVGAVVDGTALVATVPTIVARTVLALRPHLRTTPFPLSYEGGTSELLWPQAQDDDPAGRFLRGLVREVAAEHGPERGRGV